MRIIFFEHCLFLGFRLFEFLSHPGGFRLARGTDAVDGCDDLLRMETAVFDVVEGVGDVGRLNASDFSTTCADGLEVVTFSEACLVLDRRAFLVLDEKSEGIEEFHIVVDGGSADAEGLRHDVIDLIRRVHPSFFVEELENGVALGCVPHPVLLDIPGENELYRLQNLFLFHIEISNDKNLAKLTKKFVIATHLAGYPSILSKIFVATVLKWVLSACAAVKAWSWSSSFALGLRRPVRMRWRMV